MAVTPTTFKARYPEFDSIADARIQVFIDDALLEVDENRWDTFFDRGVSALTAHFLALSEYSKDNEGKVGSVGIVSVKSIGDVSIGFGNPHTVTDSKTQEFYNTTVYGQDYYRLMQLIGIDALAVD